MNISLTEGKWGKQMINSNGKVLILTSDFGEGHQQVAKAIAQAMNAYYPQADCQIVNIVAHLHPRLHPISRTMYLHALKKLPSLYGYLYRKTSSNSMSSYFLNELSTMGIKRLERLLEDEQPSLVVSTFPFASGAMSLLREQRHTSVPLVTVITDQTIHHAWIHPSTDLYLVGSQDVKEGLIRNGVAEERIQVTGIPLRLPFERTYSKEQLRARYELDATIPTVLIAGGGFGMFGDDLFDSAGFDSIPFSMQIIVVCGHNKKAQALAEQKFKSSRHRVIIQGFVDNMHEWMALSDLILTKPGGVTTAEAMALGVPMLLCKPIPGQEEDNLNYLVRAGVAYAAPTSEQLFETLHVLMKTPVLLSQMQRCAEREGRKQASRETAVLLHQMTQQPQTELPWRTAFATV